MRFGIVGLGRAARLYHVPALRGVASAVLAGGTDSSAEQRASMELRSPLGAAGSVIGFLAIIAAIVATAWVSQSRAAAWSAVVYPLLLTIAYWLIKKPKPR